MFRALGLENRKGYFKWSPSLIVFGYQSVDTIDICGFCVLFDILLSVLRCITKIYV